MAGTGDQQQQGQVSRAQALDSAVEEKGIRFAFEEYLKQRPDTTEPIEVKDYIARVFAIVGHPEPTYESLYRNALSPSTDEPWPEALFAYRVKRHLESPDCKAVDWSPVDYWDLPGAAERRSARVESLERYEFVLCVLARLQQDHRAKILADVQKRIEAEVALVGGDKTPGKSEQK